MKKKSPAARKLTLNNCSKVLKFFSRGIGRCNIFDEMLVCHAILGWFLIKPQRKMSLNPWNDSHNLVYLGGGGPIWDKYWQMMEKLAKEALWKCLANKTTVNRKAGCTHNGKKCPKCGMGINMNRQQAQESYLWHNEHTLSHLSALGSHRPWLILTL